MPGEGRGRITIVSGLPRSGTSMMMRMLDAGGLPVLSDGVRAPDADNPRGYFEYEAVKRTANDPSWVSGARNKAVKMVYALLKDLPDGFGYDVILMLRRLTEVHASQEVMLERKGDRFRAMDLFTFERLFGEELRRVVRLLELKPNFRVLQVDYNRMLEDPVREIQVIDAFLDAGLDMAAMRRVVEPELYRQRA